MLYEIFVAIAASMLLVPALVLLVECLAARAEAPGAPGDGARPPAVAVLVPAHDEAGQIGETVKALAAELGPGDRLVVVADNCSDATAEVVRSTADAHGLTGVTAIERRDPSNVGKGFAISFGVAHLAAAPPGVVVLVDADCRVAPRSLGALARAAARTGGPVQGEYLLASPPGASPLGRVSELAVLVRNQVRPRGLARLGGPCLLTGSGMAFPWHILRDAPETRGNLVEDMVLGLELALRGHPPRLCPEARISSELPAEGRAAQRQRRRWEHGHLDTLATYLPRLLAAGLARRDAGLLALAADLSVPPLALLVLAQGLVLIAALAPLVLNAAWSSATPLALAAAGLATTTLAVGVAWSRFARARVPGWTLLIAPAYLAWKLPLYVVLLLKGKQRTWERTARPGEEDRGRAQG
jgi:cellulose synthase/poly-beta-1,6-N-acetylglucosamine synthase-like glycosyltransferase